jgi:hypothetical protein
MGHAISGGGFYNIDVEPMRGGLGNGEVFAAIIKFDSAPLSESQLSDELKHLVDELWDWQVQRLSDTEFSVVFPTRQTLRLITGSGKLHLPLSKTDTQIREAFLAPKPTLVLPSTWVRLSGVPEDLMTRDRLMAGFTMIGRPIDVDELSIQKRDREPIRMRFHCRYPDRIKGSVQIFVNGEGYIVGVQAEAPPRGPPGAGSGGPPPPPNDGHDDDEDSDEIPSDSEWNKHRRSQDKNKDASQDKGGASGPSNSNPPPVLSKQGLPVTTALAMAERRFDQYGSNMAAAAEILPSLSLLEPSKSKLAVHLVPASGVDGIRPLATDSLDSLGSADMDSQITDPAPSWVDDSQQAEGPPTKMAKLTSANTLGGSAEVEVVDASDEEEMPLPNDDGVRKNLLKELSEAAPLAQARRSKAVYSKRAASATPAVRKSARSQGATAGTSALLRAQRLTAEKNLEGKAGPNTYPEKGNDFAILDLLSDAHLSSVVRDSCLVLSPTTADPGEALSIIRAKEKVQAALAETARRLELEAKAAAAAKAALVAVAGEAPRGEPAHTPGVEQPDDLAATPVALGSPGAVVPASVGSTGAPSAGAVAAPVPTRSRPRRSCAKAPALTVSKRQYKKRASK